jgi:exoribonuclease R
MQYYKDYLDYDIIKSSNNIYSGVYKNIDNTSCIKNNRAIYNDIVYYDSNDNIVGIEKRNTENIVGILYLDSKIKYGVVNNKLLYLFKPTNKKYPNFYIPYKIKNNKNKIFCIIKFKEWKITDKLPLGELIDIIGNVGDRDSEIEHMRVYYCIKNNTWKTDNEKKNNDIKILENIQNKEEDYEVFSIDPLGSKDIDDAFHFKIINNNNQSTYEVGIHIASPIHFFQNNYIDILNRVSTVYLPDKKYNMLPNIYADELISLLENKKRFAISLIINIDNDKIISFKIIETIVKNIKNYDYDTFDKNYYKDTNLMEFMNLTKKFFDIDIIDSHKLVEYWMIYTNKFIAKYLIDNNYSGIILRSHQINENKDKRYVIDNILNKYLKLREENSAKYILYNKNDIDICYTHSKLNNDYYTHFTSPIRRAVDFYTHLLLLNKLNINIDIKLEDLINKINIFTKNCRKFDRTIRRLNFIYDIKDIEAKIETYGYIINITKNKLTLYIPEYNLEEKVIIIPYKFESIWDIIIDKDINNNICKICFNNNNNNISNEYQLYEKLNIKLWVFTSFENIFDKLKIEVIKN